jgi:predicted dehydrogenase
MAAPHPVGFGIFGYGFVAGAHCTALRAIGARPVAVCGPRADAARAFAVRHGIPETHVFQRPEELLALPEVTAVIVATPDDSHHDLTIAAAEAGKHVFCEKPLALNLEQARAMWQAVQRAGVRSMTGFLLRYAPIVQTIQGLVQRGQLGRLLSVHCERYNASLLRPDPAMSWRHDPRRCSAGVLADLGSHMIDLARCFAGEIVEVCADLRTYVDELRDPATRALVPHRLDDDATLLVRFANGAHGTISVSRVGIVDSHHPLGRSFFELNGTQAGVTTDGVEHGSFFRRGEPPQEIVPERSPAGLDHAGVLAYMGEHMLGAFIEAIQTGQDRPPTIEDGLRAQAVIDAALRSHASRRWEQVLH